VVVRSVTQEDCLVLSCYCSHPLSRRALAQFNIDLIPNSLECLPIHLTVASTQPLDLTPSDPEPTNSNHNIQFFIITPTIRDLSRAGTSPSPHLISSNRLTNTPSSPPLLGNPHTHPPPTQLSGEIVSRSASFKPTTTSSSSPRWYSSISPSLESRAHSLYQA
jgi:hypothetical protein